MTNIFFPPSSSAASAIAGNTFLRSITAAGFPLFARQMYTGMGIQWASTLLGCVALLLVPIPVTFYVYGRKLRERSRFSPTMGEQPPPGEDEESTTDGEVGVGASITAATNTMTGNRTGLEDGDVEKRTPPS